MTLAAIDRGEGDPVVLLHGQPGGAGDWTAVTGRLEGRMRILAPDRPGYGRTGGHAVGFRANAEAVAGMLTEVDLDGAIVATHSWATGVGLALARFFPAKVRALVLVAPIAPGVPPGAVDRALAHPVVGAAAVRVSFRVAGTALALEPVRALARRFMPTVPPGHMAAMAREWRGDRAWRSFHLEQRALFSELPALRPELGSIEQPTTILEGERDRISGPAHSSVLASVMPRAELVRIEGAGHLLPQERPDAVSEAIARAAGRP